MDPTRLLCVNKSLLLQWKARLEVSRQEWANLECQVRASWVHSTTHHVLVTPMAANPKRRNLLDFVIPQRGANGWEE